MREATGEQALERGLCVGLSGLIREEGTQIEESTLLLGSLEVAPVDSSTIRFVMIFG